MLAIIGGSGLDALSSLEVPRRQVVPTPYGQPSGALTFGKMRGHDVIFLARHGEGHTIPPHEVNYRANTWALHAQGVTHVISIASVGGIRNDLRPGVLALPHQLIDYTYGRAATFFTRGDRGVHHIDFTLPYTQALRTACLTAAQRAGENLSDGGVYAATQGPRLETAAEIDRLERDGADMVGMTGMPEAALAREMGLSYAAIAVVANDAAGRGGSKQRIAMSELTAELQQAMKRVRSILDQLVVFHGD
jgi:5'-deoxy-5'-methylthioadenosine phosphorylase